MAEVEIAKNPFDYFLDVFRKYAVFSGRSSRAEYWYFILFSFIIVICLDVFDYIFFKNPAIPFSIIYDLGVIIPSLAVAVRRLHDIGKSGWWWFIGLIPIVGGIILIVFFVKAGEPGENIYGPNPKEVGQDAAPVLK